VVVVAVTVADTVAAVEVEDPVVAEDPVNKDPEAEVEATSDAGAMAQQTALRIPNSMPAQRPTAGLVVMTAPKSMIARPVTTNYRDTKTQQPQLIQREAPQKIKSSLSGNDVVGSYKRIILKRKKLKQNQ
jgi:hypothetical protein